MVIFTGRLASMVCGPLVSLSFLLAPLFFLCHISEATNKVPILAFCALFWAAGIFIGKAWLNFFHEVSYKSNAKRVYPDQPWKWRNDWANGTIISSPGDQGRMGMGFAFFGNFFVVFIIALILDESKLSQKAKQMVEFRYGISILLFLVGAYLFLRAYLHWARTKKFLSAALILEALPLRTGSSFPLRVKVDPVMHFDGAIVARIGCSKIDRTRNVIGNPRTDLWSEEVEARQEGAHVNIRGAELPTNLPSATVGDNEFDIEWWLALLGTVRSEEVILNFNLPVFK